MMSPRTLPILSLLVVLGLLTLLGLWQLSTPDSAPTTATATEFSADRAMDHLRVIAAEPRAAGLAGHAATQQYLIDELQATGLDPQVQSTSVVLPGEAGAEGFSAGTVENVIARIPGTGSTGSIAIDAHYDTGATGPGAMDAGAGVVATLETVRAIQAGPPLANDVIIVFADGEETGMMGAKAFNEQHPWAEDVKLTLNFEGAGGDGVAMLYATSEDNNWIVSEFLDVAPDPAAYSLLPSIVHLFPEGRLDCDLGEFTEEGSAGLGFVAIGDTPAYHTVRDNPDLIDSGSIQQMGGYTLATVQHFGNLDLTEIPRTGDRVFFNVLPGVVVDYAVAWVIPLALVLSAIVLGLVVIGYRGGEMTIRGLAGGAVAFLLGSLGAVVLSVVIWAMIRMFNADYQVMMIGTYQSTLYVVALTFSTIAAIGAVYTWLRRRMRIANLVAGALLGAMIPLWVASILVPSMSYLVLWPMSFAIVPLAWMLLASERSSNLWGRAAALAIGAIPTLILIPGTLYAMVGLANRLEGLMGFPILGIVMLVVAPPVALLVLHFDFLSGATRWRRWTVPIAAAAIAVALIGWGSATSGFDAEQPRPDRIAYEFNADTGRAQWVSRDEHLDSWTAQFFPDDVTRSEYDSLLLGEVGAFTGPAPVVPVTKPDLTIVNDMTDGEVRTVDIRMMAEDARLMVANIQAPAEVVAIAVNGQPVNLSGFEWVEDGEFPVIYNNVPGDGWELTISIRSAESLTIDVETVTDDLPGQAMESIAPRPPETMPAPDYARDPTIVRQSFQF